MTAPSQLQAREKQQKRTAQKRALRESRKAAETTSASSSNSTINNNVSRPSASIVAITKSSARAPNLSAARIKIENYLASLPPDATVTTKQVSEACGSCMKKVSNTLHSIARDGYAVNTSTNKTHSAWRKKDNTNIQQRRSNATESSYSRVCNGNQPNGSRAYWKAFETQRLTPARLELLQPTTTKGQEC